MKWSPQDIDVYLQSKEYVDTAVIPLLPIAFDKEMKQTASSLEFITLISSQLERQFRGRLMLFPGFSYIRTSINETEISNLKIWEDQILSYGFKHIFYLTSDTVWNTSQDNFTGSLIWLPSIPIETMEESAKISVIESQVKQMINLFTQKWSS